MGVGCADTASLFSFDFTVRWTLYAERCFSGRIITNKTAICNEAFDFLVTQLTIAVFLASYRTWKTKIILVEGTYGLAYQSRAFESMGASDELIGCYLRLVSANFLTASANKLFVLAIA